MGTKYIYEGNFDPRDNTEKITGVGPDGDDELLLGGEAKEVSDEQYAVLSTRYNLQPEHSGNGESQQVVTPPSEPDEPTTSSETTTNEPSTASPSGGKSRGRQS